ncbi:hypothetical protein BJF79_36765 [Actinomadura sp. CNU-125]|uniref:DUF6049 family protein n=1 Tax=Actinomadura sp. CNU-125 TaxID=1904961 RepID=UPI00096896A4|nr:DUF6049 family protein [Actinomadura sp. CNU-125]OLT31933.1 hypothetical protein BJF79_36765 [Actinomadura sp. CNU-125]
MRTLKRAVALAALLPALVWAADPALAGAHRSAPSRTTPQQAAPQQQTTPLQPGTRGQVGIALTEIGPKTVRADSKIKLTGLVRNRTDAALDGVSVRLRFSNQPVNSRSMLEQYSETPAYRLPYYGPTQRLKSAAEPGVKYKWGLETTAKALRLANVGTPGVYPVGVEVLNAAGAPVGGLTTFLTYMPDSTNFKPVSIGWVWPMADTQHRTTDETFIDDELAADLAPDGRLTRLVNAAKATDTPITWSIDPALLDDVRRMASGEYTVREPGSDESETKPQNPAAATWLKSLAAASKDDSYFTLPYADPDLLALVRHKMPRSVAAAFAPENGAIATEVLGRAPDARVAWPTGGAVGHDTADWLAENVLGGGGAFLLSSRHFQQPAQGTPNATTTFKTSHGTKPTLLYDDKLSNIVSDSGDTIGSSLLTEQRFLAETAMIAGEAPAVQRTVVVAPDRRWNPVAGLAERLLDYSGGADWLKDVRLSDIEKAEPQARTWRNYPDHYEKYELGESYLKRVWAIARRAESFHSVMVEPYNLSYQKAMLRIVSSAWRSDSKGAKEARVALADRLALDMGRVRVLTTENKRINMTGSTGTLPVTIENRLSDQAVRVRLLATSENTAKLQLGTLEPEQQLIELQPGERVTRWVPAQAYGNGIFRMNLQLVHPATGRPFGDGETVTVRATGYGQIALLITGGGLAVLFVGVGVRAIRARRRRKAEAAGDGSTGMGPGATGGPGDGLPGPGFAGPGLPDPELSGTAPWAGGGAGSEPGAPVPPAEPAEPAEPEPGVSPSGATRADPGTGGPAR